MTGKTVPAGGHTLFMDLKERDWTLIVSDWQPQQRFNPGNGAKLSGGVWLHEEQGRGACADGADDAAISDRAVDVGVPGHVGRGWHHRVPLGHGDGDGEVHGAEEVGRVGLSRTLHQPIAHRPSPRAEKRSLPAAAAASGSEWRRAPDGAAIDSDNLAVLHHASQDAQRSGVAFAVGEGRHSRAPLMK